MCKEKMETTPCLNYRCPHNLFWEGLKLNVRKIHVTAKARQIRNCCRLIHEPWTSEEIAEAWGLKRGIVTQLETIAWRQIQVPRIKV